MFLGPSWAGTRLHSAWAEVCKFSADACKGSGCRMPPSCRVVGTYTIYTQAGSTLRSKVINRWHHDAAQHGNMTWIEQVASWSCTGADHQQLLACNFGGSCATLESGQENGQASFTPIVSSLHEFILNSDDLTKCLTRLLRCTYHENSDSCRSDGHFISSSIAIGVCAGIQGMIK